MTNVSHETNKMNRDLKRYLARSTEGSNRSPTRQTNADDIRPLLMRLHPICPIKTVFDFGQRVMAVSQIRKRSRESVFVFVWGLHNIRT